jgi:type IV pilus assembly protein PilF
VRKLPITILPCIFFLVTSCASISAEKKATAHYKIGVSYLNENKAQQAYVEFFKAYELDPNNKEVLNAIGVVYLLHFDEPLKAVEFFEKAVKVAPDYSDAYNNLGYSYEKLGEYEKAIPFYKKAISNPIYSTAEKAYYNMGYSYYRLGKYESALNSFKEAIKRAPTLGLAYMRLSLCYNAMGKYGDAATAMTQAIALDPVYKGDREKAMEDLNVKKIKAAGYEEQDLTDYIEILKY